LKQIQEESGSPVNETQKRTANLEKHI